MLLVYRLVIQTGYTSAEKTAFSTDFGHFHFIGTPMGARNTPAYFQNRVETVLKKAGLIDIGVLSINKEGIVSMADGRACCSPYIDDVILYSLDLDTHFQDLDRVFTCLSENYYYLQPAKCHFCCKYVMFAGGIVGNGVLAMNPDKIEAIRAWTTPSDATELRAFIGTTNYLKQFYNNYSDVSRVLTALLKKGKSVGKDWGPEHD